MANIKEYKKKIKSVKGTLKITSAMKLVAGAKLAKAQGAIVSAKPYNAELQDLIRTVLASSYDYEHPYMDETPNKKALLLVISSDRGLCGSFNSQLAREVMGFIREHTEYEFKVHFVGKKVREMIEDLVSVGETHKFSKGEPTDQEIRHLANHIGELFTSGEFGKVFVAYNVFRSAISFTPSVEQFLPVTISEQEKAALEKKGAVDFKYEPNAKELLDKLIPESYINRLFCSFLDSHAAEHGSRMTAMDNASKNCKEAIRVKTLKMNKIRQAKITTELIEVVSGAEALNN